MPEDIIPHEIALSVDLPPETVLDAGADLALKIKVSCADKCDLRGGQVRLVDQAGGMLKELDLRTSGEEACETAEFIVMAPSRPGPYTWAVTFVPKEEEGGVHGGISIPVSFFVRPHLTGIAVWDVPSPVTYGAEFTLKVGVSCSSACKLTGQAVEIRNDAGQIVAKSELGELAWEETKGLYWVEMTLRAPTSGDAHRWTANFPTPGLDLAHDGAEHAFSFGTANAPDKVVTVEVVDLYTGKPIEKAAVTLHATGAPYDGYTDKAGAVRLHVPGGQYRLYVYRRFYEDFQTTIEVSDDLTFKAELMFAPDGGV